MAAFVEVFCKQPIVLDVAALEADLRGADLMTMAETLDPPPDDEEALVEEMWTHFRIQASPLEIHWSPKFRAIQIYTCRDVTVAAIVTELIAELPDDDGPGPTRVREHLAATKEILTFELSFDGADHMGGLLVEELAFAMAERADGLIWFWRRSFAAADDRATPLWEPEL